MRVSHCSTFDPCDGAATQRSERHRRGSGDCAATSETCAPDPQPCAPATPAADWSSCTPRPSVSSAAARADALFAALDADEDGSISECEFKAGAKALLRQGRHGGDQCHGYGRHGRLDRVLGRLFDRVDADGDGSVTKDELTAALTRRSGTPAAQPPVEAPAPVAPAPAADAVEPEPVEPAPVITPAPTTSPDPDPLNTPTEPAGAAALGTTTTVVTFAFVSVAVQSYTLATQLSVSSAATTLRVVTNQA